jgi:Na+-transporting methylmalonyl-CoA/oxaloacetate decarboxylase gamma subunit
MNILNLHHIGLTNFRTAGLDPVGFSIFGMAIVFCGLIIISLYIYFLPKLLGMASLFKKKMTANSAAGKKIDEDISPRDAAIREYEIITAIAAAFHLDQDFPEESQKITWLSHGLDESAWLSSGIAHGVSRRHHLHITRRKF